MPKTNVFKRAAENIVFCFGSFLNANRVLCCALIGSDKWMEKIFNGYRKIWIDELSILYFTFLFIQFLQNTTMLRIGFEMLLTIQTISIL